MVRSVVGALLGDLHGAVTRQLLHMVQAHPGLNQVGAACVPSPVERVSQVAGLTILSKPVAEVQRGIVAQLPGSKTMVCLLLNMVSNIF